MQFSFQTTIQETPGAINTAAVVSEKLAKAIVAFGKTKDGFPGIFTEVDGRKITVAFLKQAGENYGDVYGDYGDWYRSYARLPQNGHGHESAIFPHLTDAAFQLVKAWVESLCDEYEARLKRDMQPA